MYVLICETGFFTEPGAHDSGRQPGQSRPLCLQLPSTELPCSAVCLPSYMGAGTQVPIWQALDCEPSSTRSALLCLGLGILFFIHLFAGERGRLAYVKMKLSGFTACAEPSASLLKYVCRPSIWDFKEHGAGGKNWKT